MERAEDIRYRPLAQESKQLTRNLGQEIEKQNEKVLSLVGAVLQPEEN